MTTDDNMVTWRGEERWRTAWLWFSDSVQWGTVSVPRRACLCARTYVDRKDELSNGAAS